jgi:hypothetical protein
MVGYLEVHLLLYHLMVGEKGGHSLGRGVDQARFQAEAQAQSIAAQIQAEMPETVCHPEYYKLGEQKVIP